LSRPFKIAVAGSHSTGKTTFLTTLQRAIEDLGLKADYVHDSAADARDLGFPILSGHTFESTAWLMARAIELETAASLTADVILVDRPLHDALGYLRAALAYSGRSIEASRMHTLEGLCEAWAAEYDLMFVTAIDPAIPVAEGRDPDLLFRDRAAKEVRKVIETYFPSRWQLLRPDAEETVLSHLRERSARA